MRRIALCWWCGCDRCPAERKLQMANSNWKRSCPCFYCRSRRKFQTSWRFSVGKNIIFCCIIVNYLIYSTVDYTYLYLF
jgi:hypothetical protein